MNNTIVHDSDDLEFHEGYMPVESDSSHDDNEEHSRGWFSRKIAKLLGGANNDDTPEGYYPEISFDTEIYPRFDKRNKKIRNGVLQGFDCVQRPYDLHIVYIQGQKPNCTYVVKQYFRNDPKKKGKYAFVDNNGDALDVSDEHGPIESCFFEEYKIVEPAKDGKWNVLVQKNKNSQIEKATVSLLQKQNEQIVSSDDATENNTDEGENTNTVSKTPASTEHKEDVVHKNEGSKEQNQEDIDIIWQNYETLRDNITRVWQYFAIMGEKERNAVDVKSNSTLQQLKQYMIEFIKDIRLEIDRLNLEAGHYNKIKKQYDQLWKVIDSGLKDDTLNSFFRDFNKLLDEFYYCVYERE